MKSIMYFSTSFTGVTNIRVKGSLGFYSFTKPSAEAVRCYYIGLLFSSPLEKFSLYSHSLISTRIHSVSYFPMTESQ